LTAAISGLEGIDPRPQLRANIVQRGGQIFLRHFVEIGPGGKARVAVDHADADVGINRRGLQRLGNLR
jgi:hypothetical protein